MSSQKSKKILSIDERGRITLPKELREGIDTFTMETMKDGAIKLVPQISISLKDAAIVESLKKSATQFKKGETKKVPTDWIE